MEKDVGLQNVDAVEKNIIYTSSCIENDVAGYAGIIFRNDNALKVTVGKGKATLNQMQTLSVIESIKLGFLYCPTGIVQVVTDSEYVADVCEKLPTFRRNKFVNMKNPSMWREMFEVMRTLGDRLFISYKDDHLSEKTRKTALYAIRTDISDYAFNPDTYQNIIRGVILK